MDHQAVNTAVARLAVLATEDVPPETTLAELCDLAAEVLTVDGVGVMLTAGHEHRFIHATTAAAELMEHTQEALRAGPCRDAASHGQRVLLEGAEDFDTWPGFATTATRAGIGSMVAIPLMSRGRCWGVLDLYRARPGPWSEQDLDAAQLLTDVATSHVVTGHDRDAARLAQTELAHISSHDDLTGLPNRMLLMDRLGHAIESAARRRRAVGVIFADIDRFKAHNDHHGHRGGDVVLRETARRMSAALREHDTVARLSGDEFVVICDDLPLEETDGPLQALRTVAARIEHEMLVPVSLDTGTVTVQVSMGAAVTSGAMSAAELLHEADLAMYEVKHRRGTFASTARDDTAPGGQTPTSAASHLVHALERGQLEVHYQPIVPAADRQRVHGAEALLRWRHEDGSVIAARSFIELATSQGLMPAIGAWVIDRVCSQVASWVHELGEHAPEVAWINLSARELSDPALPETLAAACSRHDVSPARIGLEVVEDNFVHPGVMTRLRNLRSGGHRLSIDDFGTGYSSVSRLVDLDVDAAKIDRTFVWGLPDDGRRAALIHAVISIARALGIDVVAEGVETEAQQRFLTDAGCSSLQGYLIGRPSPAESITAALRHQHTGDPDGR